MLEGISIKKIEKAAAESQTKNWDATSQSIRTGKFLFSNSGNLLSF